MNDLFDAEGLTKPPKPTQFLYRCVEKHFQLIDRVRECSSGLPGKNPTEHKNRQDGCWTYDGPRLLYDEQLYNPTGAGGVGPVDEASGIPIATMHGVFSAVLESAQTTSLEYRARGQESLSARLDIATAPPSELVGNTSGALKVLLDWLEKFIVRVSRSRNAEIVLFALACILIFVSTGSRSGAPVLPGQYAMGALAKKGPVKAKMGVGHGLGVGMSYDTYQKYETEINRAHPVPEDLSELCKSIKEQLEAYRGSEDY
jgi:hypothetical protein